MESDTRSVPVITGQKLIEWGFTPGKWFAEAIEAANQMAVAGVPEDVIASAVARIAPAPVQEMPLRTNSLPVSVLIDAETDEERENVAAVIRHMDEVMRTPVVRAGVVMPDACPAPGSLPVGGVVASEAIHPGFHSSDVCCSMAVSIFKRSDDPSKLLDAGMLRSHFGSGKRVDRPGRDSRELSGLVSQFESNRFLRGLEDRAIDGFMTQGDGNHFFYAGEIGEKLAVVTHHGSRGLGAELYKRGMVAAKKHTSIASPRSPDYTSWIQPGEEEDEYWRALQLVRLWTKLNHFAIHDAVSLEMGNRVEDRFWNEHNFVFRKSDGLYYHAKGATPNWAGYSEDDSGLTLVPLNMSEPILLLEHADNPAALGFAPHGAGRNLSRTAHKRALSQEMGADSRGLSLNNVAEIMARETKGLDVRFYTGRPDVTELPSAYKNAGSVAGQIEKYRIGRVVDRVLPHGTIMAGEPDRSSWKKKRRSKER